MSTIKTANYLVGAVTVPLNAKPMSKWQLKYASVDEYVEKEGFVITSPGGHQLSKGCFGTRSAFPGCIKQIFLHHTATSSKTSNKGIISIFNKRSFKGDGASSHRGIAYNGSEEKYMDDKYRAYCQGGVPGHRFNTTGMSVELISLGYLLNEPLTKDLSGKDLGGTFYRQTVKHGSKYWVPESETALAVDFKGNTKEFKGYSRWNAYSQAQVNATVKLIREWGAAYKIPFVFDQKAFDNMFLEKANPDLVRDNPGVYSHCSVVSGKFDIYPDPLLVATFKKEFAKGNSLDF